jgi:hypothetical protein
MQREYILYNMENLIITDKTVIAFFKENTHLDINIMNHIFVDILKQLSRDFSKTLDNSMTTQILSIVSDLKGELFKLNSDVMQRLNSTKKEYIDDIKPLFSHSELSTQEKINHLLEKSNDALLTKTTLLMSDIIPKSNDKSYASVETCIKQFFTTIAEDTKQLLKLSEAEKSGELEENIERNIQKMFSNIQQSLFNAIQASESRTFTNIQQLNDNIVLQKQVQENLSTELNIFLNKYKSNSSVKGNVSECELYSLVQQIVPYDFLISCSAESCSCDLRLTRKDKRLPTILFENKDYSLTVNTEEVEKFERDLKLQRCHGIFLSQNSPIAYKNNFQIDIIGNLIHLYIPNAGYDTEKVKLAINIVDSLSEKLDLAVSSLNDEIYELSIDDFENLKKEYCDFANRKVEMLDLIKILTKQLTDKLNAIEMPVLKRLTVGIIETKQLGIICSICNSFNAKNKGSLAAHMRKCKTEHPDKKVTPPPPTNGFVKTK